MSRAAEFVGGPFAEALLDGVELVAISPGLSPTHALAAPLMKAAKARGVEVVGEIELFAREAGAAESGIRGYVPRVLGITGTNGKTTTTRLVGMLVERCGQRVRRRRQHFHRLRSMNWPRGWTQGTCRNVWVLELSSFQLQTTTSLACDAAAVLNLTQDHLDWHGTMDAYAKAKEAHLRCRDGAGAESRRPASSRDDRAQGDRRDLRLPAVRRSRMTTAWFTTVE